MVPGSSACGFNVPWHGMSSLGTMTSNSVGNRNGNGNHDACCAAVGQGAPNFCQVMYDSILTSGALCSVPRLKAEAGEFYFDTKKKERATTDE